jgi:hypothetical protein
MSEKPTPPRIYSCQEWGAVKPRHGSAVNEPVGIVIHHTAGANRVVPTDAAKDKAACFALARSFQHDHMLRDHRIADSLQHFTVFRGGLICEGRRGSLATAIAGDIIAGGHTGDPKTNAVQWGIECEGRYDQADRMTERQWLSLVELCAWLSFWGGFQSASITGHQEHSSTACPGLLMKRLPALRLAVKKRKVEIISELGELKR